MCFVKSRNIQKIYSIYKEFHILNRLIQEQLFIWAMWPIGLLFPSTIKILYKGLLFLSFDKKHYRQNYLLIPFIYLISIKLMSSPSIILYLNSFANAWNCSDTVCFIFKINSNFFQKFLISKQISNLFSKST